MNSSNLPEKGYPALSTLMGPHRGLAQFKRFAVLSTYSVLMQQAELLDLENQLQAHIAADQELSIGNNKSFLALSESVKNGDKISNELWEILLQIRQKLKDYRMAFTRYIRASTLTWM